MTARSGAFRLERPADQERPAEAHQQNPAAEGPAPRRTGKVQMCHQLCVETHTVLTTSIFAGIGCPARPWTPSTPKERPSDPVFIWVWHQKRVQREASRSRFRLCLASKSIQREAARAQILVLLAPRKMEFRERRSEHRPTRRSADWAEPGVAGSTQSEVCQIAGFHCCCAFRKRPQRDHQNADPSPDRPLQGGARERTEGALPDKGRVLTGGAREVDGRCTGGAREVDGRWTGGELDDSFTFWSKIDSHSTPEKTPFWCSPQQVARSPWRWTGGGREVHGR